MSSSIVAATLPPIAMHDSNHNNSNANKHNNNNNSSSTPPTPPSSSSCSSSASQLNKKVSVACQRCKKAHAACDSQRPCQRCVNLGKEAECQDATPKKRGRKPKALLLAAAAAAAAGASTTSTSTTSAMSTATLLPSESNLVQLCEHQHQHEHDGNGRHHKHPRLDTNDDDETKTNNNNSNKNFKKSLALSLPQATAIGIGSHSALSSPPPSVRLWATQSDDALTAASTRTPSMTSPSMATGSPPSTSSSSAALAPFLKTGGNRSSSSSSSSSYNFVLNNYCALDYNKTNELLVNILGELKELRESNKQLRLVNEELRTSNTALRQANLEIQNSQHQMKDALDELRRDYRLLRLELDAVKGSVITSNKNSNGSKKESAFAGPLAPSVASDVGRFFQLLPSQQSSVPPMGAWNGMEIGMGMGVTAAPPLATASAVATMTTSSSSTTDASATATTNTAAMTTSMNVAPSGPAALPMSISDSSKPFGIFKKGFNNEDMIIAANEPFCELFGYNKSEILRLTWKSLIISDALDAEKNLPGHAGSNFIAKRVTFQNKNGVPFEAITHHQVYFEDCGAPSWSVVSVEQVTAFPPPRPPLLEVFTLDGEDEVADVDGDIDGSKLRGWQFPDGDLDAQVSLFVPTSPPFFN